MSVAQGVLATLFLCWGILSVLCQKKTRLAQYLRAWDSFGLIPSWTFFAPNPVSADNYLYYRDHGPSSVGVWRRAFNADSRTAVDAIWCPLRREEKAVSDAMFHLLDQSEEVGEVRLHYSISYLVILSYVESRLHDVGATATQFMFAAKRRGKNPIPLFVSDVHVIGASQ